MLGSGAYLTILFKNDIPKILDFGRFFFYTTQIGTVTKQARSATVFSSGLIIFGYDPSLGGCKILRKP